MYPKKKTATGSYPRVDAGVVKELLARHEINAAQLAQLARAGIQRNNLTGYSSRTVAHWTAGTRGMPQSTYELVETKLWLVENGHATLDEVMKRSLKELLETMLSHKVNVTK